MKSSKTSLGRGLNALFESTPEITPGEEPNYNGVLMVDIRKIEPNPDQPRQYFNDEALAELAESMVGFGIVQPLLVKKTDDYFTIIAGERRYRAARMAKLKELPVLVKDYSEMEILQVALIENIQRQDLTPIEEAVCFKRLMDDFFFSADEVSAKLGKNKHSVINSLHLLELGQRARELASEGKLTSSHAKVLLNIEDETLQASCAEKIAELGLSVRESEKIIKLALRAASTDSKEEDSEDENFVMAFKRAEDELKHILGSNVKIQQGKKKSKIEIEYYNAEDLERLIQLIKGDKHG